MNNIAGFIAYCAVTAGVVIDVFAAVALFRFRGVERRLIASTRLITLGTALILAGVAIRYGFTPSGVKALLCIAFILVSSPLEAHVLLRAFVNGRESKGTEKKP